MSSWGGKSKRDHLLKICFMIHINDQNACGILWFLRCCYFYGYYVSNIEYGPNLLQETEPQILEGFQ